MQPVFDSTIHTILKERLTDIEEHFDSDTIFCFGPISRHLTRPFRDMIEHLKKDEGERDRLAIILNSPGGSAEVVEQLVHIVRHFYSEVYFIVPDAAYSAGTIFCMSGDKIFMDYSSSLGPIDPQVEVRAPNGMPQWVSALGYLDKVEELIEKSANDELTRAELIMLQQQDFAMLRAYEDAKNLTKALLMDWLVKYKFKDWDTHETNPDKIGKSVTKEEKEERAEEVANCLGDNRTWHSHGRSINIETLTNVVRLKIEDYSQNDDRRELIRNFNDLITEYIRRNDFDAYLYSRNFY